VTPIQRIFSPRYPIELSPTGFQVIPDATRGSPAIPFRQTPVRHVSAHRTSRGGGPTYVFRCPRCRKLFYRKTHNSSLSPHKRPDGRMTCYGSYGAYVRTKY
jgi:hypothetical protein